MARSRGAGRPDRRKRGTAIPGASRAIVRQRDRQRCQRCGVPAPRGQWHHRRTRSVVDLHQHCACNGILLCHTCHTWVHQHPADAKRDGFIVSRYVQVPATVPAMTWNGLRHQHCNGQYIYEGSVTEREERP